MSHLLGLHVGNIHLADLGDGDNRKPEEFLARQYYFPIWGTCWESLYGGHHFRAWHQNGTLAPAGAWFLGVSKEENTNKHHTISKDGYNVGRDWLVDKALKGNKWKGIWWQAELEWVEGLLEPGRDGKLNCFSLLTTLLMSITSGINHHIAQDGRVAVLTVNRGM